MSANSSLSEFLKGMRLGVPVIVASAPFGLLFGALAVKNGLTIPETVLMSATVYAGASQMVGIELFGQKVAPWLIVLSIFAVNFRHVLYSASLGRRLAEWSPPRQVLGFFLLTDPQYAESERRAGPIPFAWYIGMAAPMYCCWVAEAWLGAVFGRLIPNPHALGLDFLLPIYFLGLVMGFRQRPLWLPVVIVSTIASIGAYLTIGSPWHVSVGAAAGVLLAALMPPGDKAPANLGKEAVEAT